MFQGHDSHITGPISSGIFQSRTVWDHVMQPATMLRDMRLLAIRSQNDTY
jgi:hypothetical protein